MPEIQEEFEVIFYGEPENEGDRVALTADRYDDETYNPVWGGEQGEMMGTVTEINEDYGNVDVTWDNGINNCYERSDLEVVEIVITGRVTT